MSNQRPNSTVEFAHTKDRQHQTLQLDENGLCDACKFAELKEKIDWIDREKELLKLLDKHRMYDGNYDCIVPGSGGKDSALAAHILKEKYGMHPLTITWPPLLYTDIGWRNFQQWIDVGGFSNVSFRPNGEVHRLLTRLSTENLFHPFQTFILGQKNLAPRLAVQFGVPLVFYGENEAEYGNPISENSNSLRDQAYFARSNMESLHLAGVPVAQLIEEYGVSKADLLPYLLPASEDLERTKVEIHYLGYYLKWTPQEAYYYAVENTGFEANSVRTEGTYSKYNSLDDKADGLHYYTTYIKFGIGRATYDAAQEIRNKHITREEGVALVHRFDGEFPATDFEEVMDYIGMTPERFMELRDQARSPHLWKQENGEWKLRHQVT